MGIAENHGEAAMLGLSYQPQELSKPLADLWLNLTSLRCQHWWASALYCCTTHVLHSFEMFFMFLMRQLCYESSVNKEYIWQSVPNMIQWQFEIRIGTLLFTFDSVWSWYCTECCKQQNNVFLELADMIFIPWFKRRLKEPDNPAEIGSRLKAF